VHKEPMTSAGYDKLTALLNDMKLVQRPKIIKAVDEARQLGDLKENAEYHAAKDKQGLMEARILDLTDLVARAHVIDPVCLPHKRVSFGSKVELIDQEDDSEICYSIVGSQESNPEKGLISIGSPMGKALLGKEEGDEVEINLPNGKKIFDIENISCMDKI